MVYNTYGPTEATVAVTGIKLTPEIIEAYNPLPVGVSRPNTSLFTTDEGELVIKGNSVSLGYLDNKEKPMRYLTLKMDFVYIIRVIKPSRKDGQWFIQGRIDFQIKLNGYRMELEEIETQLRQSEFVRETVVVQYIKIIK